MLKIASAPTGATAAMLRESYASAFARLFKQGRERKLMEVVK
jgi:hypothetical protein